MTITHAVFVNPDLHGFEYGSLRDFEDAIVGMTGGLRVALPDRHLPRWMTNRLRHGTRYAQLRSLLPKATFPVCADVTWTVLMGPENFQLDFYKDWESGSGYKILYIFDTFPIHMSVLRRVLRAARWDLTITSFASAVPMLEAQTQRKWHAVPQGISENRFLPAPDSDRIIEFSAYGRRQPQVHGALLDYAHSTGDFYDYSFATGLAPAISPQDAYALYGWHLAHSAFTFCWPVEMTHPARAGGISPVTCRWFEAAASGAVVVGRRPADPAFIEAFGEEAVVEINPESSREEMISLLEGLKGRRAELLAKSLARRAARVGGWTWESRVKAIIALGELG